MKYFTLKEMTFSATAKNKQLANSYTYQEQQNIEEFVNNLLDSLRSDWTEYCITNNLGTGAIRVTSGFRNHLTNMLVNGSKTSAHLLGYAADIVPSNGNMKEFQEFVVRWIKDKDFDQCIIERPINGIASWIHIGYKNKDNQQRKQIFTLV